MCKRGNTYDAILHFPLQLPATVHRTQRRGQCRHTSCVNAPLSTLFPPATGGSFFSETTLKTQFKLRNYKGKKEISQWKQNQRGIWVSIELLFVRWSEMSLLFMHLLWQIIQHLPGHVDGEMMTQIQSNYVRPASLGLLPVARVNIWSSENPSTVRGNFTLDV